MDNHSREVQVFRYVPRPGIDRDMLQAAERKARFTDQFMCRRADADETGHTSDAAVSCSEVKALATGNRC
jgi:hypothetical protein